MSTAKHAFRGTMKVLQELGLQSDNNIQTVDDAAKEIKANRQQEKKLHPSDSNNLESILLIKPQRIHNWEYHDRPAEELGDIAAFAKELKEYGQLQPCIVRKSNKADYDYELIVGERRWRAALKAQIPLKVMVQELSDVDAALKQIMENKQRKDISDYSRGISLAKLINNEVITIRKLEIVIGMSKSSIDRLLSFSKIPKEVWDSIGDKTFISARLASEIRALINKGSDYKAALIQLRNKFKEKKITTRNIKLEVLKVLENKQSLLKLAEEVKSQNGRHLFTWRRDSNSNIAISFPKGIRELLDKKQVENCLRNELESQLNEIQKQD